MLVWICRREPTRKIRLNCLRRIPLKIFKVSTTLLWKQDLLRRLMRSQRRRSIQEMLATVGPFLQMGKIDVDALLTYVLRFGFGIPNASEFHKGRDEPCAVRVLQGGW